MKYFIPAENSHDRLLVVLEEGGAISFERQNIQFEKSFF